MDRPRRTAAHAAAQKLKMSFAELEAGINEMQYEHTVGVSKTETKRRPSSRIPKTAIKTSQNAVKKTIKKTIKQAIQKNTVQKADEKSVQKASQNKSHLKAKRTADKPQLNSNVRSTKTTRKKPSAKKSPNVSVLPHGLGIDVVQIAQSHQGLHTESTPARNNKLDHQHAEFVTPYAAIEPPVKRKRVKKASLVLGLSPYPELSSPTAEQAREVERLLAGEHGEVNVPEAIPIPAKNVAGCGEVKFTLEALIRTMISAHTSMGNANMAIEGIAKTYRVFGDGLTAGCIDWDQVLAGGREKLEEAIKRGGMQKTKSRDIIGTLQMVHDENKKLRAQILEKMDGKLDNKDGTMDLVNLSTLSVRPSEDTEDDKNTNGIHVVSVANTETELEAAAPQVKRAKFMSDLAVQTLLSQEQLLTLDYVHAWPVNKIFDHLQTFPGVGVKTAACVLLFCMQRPLFAVDTHVFRICKWLAWAPADADRNKVFFHCDVRVPDQLKYKLHQLLIVHGKCCLKCRAAVGDTNPGWKDAVCCLEHLLTRTGPKKVTKAAQNQQKRDKDDTASDYDSDQKPAKKQKTKKSTKNKMKQPVLSDDQVKDSIPDTGSDSSELSSIESLEDEATVQTDAPNMKDRMSVTEQQKGDAINEKTPQKDGSNKAAAKKLTAKKLTAKMVKSTEKGGDLDDLAKVFGASAAAAMRQQKPAKKALSI